MDLDEKRTDRDYLFGQLLALADNYEYRVLLRQSGGRTPDRTTNAVKLMNNFVAKPSTTWLTLRQQLNPYIISSTNGMFFQNEVDEVMSKFKEGDFESNKPLSSLFLLGYSHKRRQLIQRADAAKQLKEQNIENKGEYHTTLKTQLQVTLDENGYPTIKRDNADIEIIAPCTEQSMGRSGTVLPPHPLFDQLQYIDANYDPVKHESYLSQLASWKGDNAKLNAIYQYLSQHSVIEDARAQGIGIDPKKDSKIGVRFAVHVRHGDYEPNVWADHAIRDLWIAHEEQVRHGASLGTDLFGETLYKPSTNFPKKIVNVNGNAKLISANDNTNFTFRGRFANRDEALSIDTLTSQKIHTTLRWLATNNGTLTGSQDIVIWAIDGHPTDNVFDPTGNSRDVAEQVDDRTDSEKLIDANVQTYANYAKQFGKLLRGYGNEKVLQQMQQHSRRIVVTIFDAATSGRLSVTFYRELSQNEYIESVLQWHEDAAWYLTCFDNKNSASTDDEAPRGSKKSSDKPKPIPYIGAPSFADVINCVYSTDDHSSDSYRRFAKYVKKQLVECMFSNAGLPASLLQPAFHKVIRPLSYDSLSVWQHDFEVACSISR